MKLIDKDALLAEIEKRKLPFKKDIEGGNYPTYLCALMDFEDLLDTLEVKDVDLDKTLTGFMGKYAYENGGEYPSAIEIAKHFFELGLNAQNNIDYYEKIRIDKIRY